MMDDVMCWLVVLARTYNDFALMSPLCIRERESVLVISDY
jgi:hypothetical protein